MVTNVLTSHTANICESSNNSKNPWDSGRNVDSSLNDISDGFAHIRAQCAEIDVVENISCVFLSHSSPSKLQ